MPRLFVRSITSVGAVNAGDNPEATIMFFKRKDTQDSKESRTTADDLAKEALMERPDLSQLGDDVREPIEAYIAKLETRPDPEDATDDGAPLEEELVKAAPQEVQDLFAKQANELAELRKAREEDQVKLDTAIEKARVREFTDEASAFPALFDKSEAGIKLAQIEAAVDPEAWTWLKERFAAAQAIMSAEGILKEVGRTEGGDKVEGLVKAKRDADPALTIEQARSQVWAEHPDLVEEVRS